VGLAINKGYVRDVQQPLVAMFQGRRFSNGSSPGENLSLFRGGEWNREMQGRASFVVVLASEDSPPHWRKAWFPVSPARKEPEIPERKT
jgi:hypothetical protein